MEVAMRIEDAARINVEIERPANVLLLQVAPLECCQADLECQKRPYGSAVSRILVPKSVKFVRLVVQGDLAAGELCIKRHEVARRDRLPD